MNQEFSSDFRGRTPNEIVGTDESMYKSVRALARKIGVHHSKITRAIRRGGVFKWDGIEYRLILDDGKQNTDNGNKHHHKKNTVELSREEYKDLDEYRHYKEQVNAVSSLTFDSYEFTYPHRDLGYRYAVALFSDAHIEETVKKESVLGKNEYNIQIAEDRIRHYFHNLAECLKEDCVEELIFASLGDTISGFIHDELAQCNGLTPLEAVMKGQSLLCSGLKYICENTELESIKFIGIVGNHSRTTKKIQHANGFAMSYEWLMYQNIRRECQAIGLPIEFLIPESEVAIVNTPDDKRFLFCHGFQIKSGGSGTVCGIYPALQRLALKWNKTFNQDRMFLGHFHSFTSIPNACVNGSIIGYNAFAMSNGMPYEEPCQFYVCYDTEIGELLQRKIYCK